MSSVVLLVEVRIAHSCVPGINTQLTRIIKISKPLKSNDNGGEDGAAEGDVVERVDDLGQEVGIDRAILGDGPLPHYTFYMVSIQDSIIDTSDEGVVKDNKDDEDKIKDGQSNKEPVEGVLHLMSRQNKDGEKVPKQTKHSKDWLNITI